MRRQVPAVRLLLVHRDDIVAVWAFEGGAGGRGGGGRRGGGFHGGAVGGGGREGGDEGKREKQCCNRGVE